MTRPATLGRLAAAHTHGDLSDHDLLDRFAAARDETAFAALVERHGSLVLDAARAILRHDQDAEDVFQAAFLVLARKAASIRGRGSLACWLHGVARRVALRALRARTRRTRHETAARPEPAAGDELTWGEVRALVHDELARLPESLRAPVLLCHLEGLTLDEAAARLGLPRGTLRGRLDRGRDLLRRRLARRGLAAGALVFPPAVSRAVPPLVVLGTARSAARFAAGLGEPSPAAALANGAMSMTAARVKVALLLAAVMGAAGIGVAASQEANSVPPTAAMPQSRDSDRPDAPVAQPAAQPAAEQPKPEFGEVTVVSRPGAFSNRTTETIRVSADGTCLYEVPQRPARGEIPAWSGAKILHKLPPERLRELNALLKGTDWLAKDPKEKLQLHHPEYTLTLKRSGKTTELVVKGESEPYAKLLHFFQSVAAQEYLVYRLEWVPAAMTEARFELDALVAAELGEPFALSPLAIDLSRYVPWATRLVREPFDKPADDVRTAVRLVGLLKLESEREYLADLANDRNGNVRIAVAQAVGRLGGEKAVPVLRKMVRGTGLEAAWELIKLGEVAVPTIAEVIREGAGEPDMSYEQLIRAYIGHWDEVPKPLDAKILDAVRANMGAPKVKAHRTTYHAELLKLAAGPPGPDGPKVEKARVEVRNLAKAAEAYKARTGAAPESLAALKEAGFVEPAATLRDPWGAAYRYAPEGKRGGGTRPDVWTVTPAKAKVGSWAAELWGVWVVRSAAAGEKKQRPSGGHWEFGVSTVAMFQSNNVFYRAARYSVDASKEPKQIDLIGTTTMKGIYEVKGDTLRVCHTLDGGERPTGFEGGPGVAVWVFERQKE
jgi:RNA polymerase sigma factor (sigma-70 family)